MKELILNGGGRPVYTDDLKIIQDNAALFEHFLTLDTKIKEQGCVLCGCEVTKGQRTTDGYTKNYAAVSEGYVFLDGRIRHVSPADYTWETDADKIPYPFYIVPEDKSSEEIIQYADKTDANLYREYSAKVITELQYNGGYSKILSLKYTTGDSKQPNRFPNFYDLWEGTTNSSLISDFKKVIENAKEATTAAQNATAITETISKKADTAVADAVKAVNLANEAATVAQTAASNANEAANKSDRAVANMEKTMANLTNLANDCKTAINAANDADKKATAAATNANNATENVNAAINSANLATEQANTAKTECEDQTAKAKNATGLAELAANKANSVIEDCEAATAAAEKVNVSYADGKMTVTDRTGATKTADLAEAATVGERLTEVEEKVAKATDSYIDCIFYQDCDWVTIDGVKQTVVAGKRYRFYPKQQFNFCSGYPHYYNYLCYLDLSHLDASGFATNYMPSNPAGSFGFGGARKLKRIYGLAQLDTKNFTHINQWFRQLESVEELDVSGWVTDNLTCLWHNGNSSSKNGWYGCTNLRRIVGLKNWNVSKIADFGAAFQDCKNLEKLDLAGWNLAALTNASNMFCNCTSLTELDASGWNLSALTNASNMFCNCTSLTELNASGWNLAKIDSTFRMFQNCTALKSIDTTGWGDLSTLTNGQQMFENCKALQSIDASGWNLAALTNASNMFCNCTSLTELDASGWNLSALTNALGMFYGCTSLTELDASGWNLSALTNASNMFCNCTSLTELDLTGFDMSKCTNANNMFQNCTALKSIKLSENFGKFPNNVNYISFGWSPWTENVDTLLSLYDRKANGLNNLTIALHASTKALLSDTDKATLTARGYVIA